MANLIRAVVSTKETAESFNKLLELSGDEQLPSTVEAAQEWINRSSTPEQRSARKALTLGLRYGMGPQRLSELLKK